MPSPLRNTPILLSHSLLLDEKLEGVELDLLRALLESLEVLERSFVLEAPLVLS